MKKVIAIDGPAGAGKSTIARKLAKKLNFVYFDSGAIYRLFTWLILERYGSIESGEDYSEYLSGEIPYVKIEFLSGERRIYYRQQLLSEKLRSERVTTLIYHIASEEKYRNLANEIIREAASQYNMVIDGRDIGTVVFPDTPYKFYLNATVEERARRRFAELQETGQINGESLIEIQNAIELRDQRDSTRKVAPLKKAKDAQEIDSSSMNIDDVVELFLLKIERIDKEKSLGII